MENKIPIPTDNIFKFYALFGLLLFVFSVGSVIYLSHSYNELVFQASIEFEALKQMPNPSSVDIAKKQVLEKRLQIAASDKNTFLHGIGVICGISLLLILYGFSKWHKHVQPVQDEIVRLQLEKLRYEVKQLKHTNPSTHKTPPE